MLERIPAVFSRLCAVTQRMVGTQTPPSKSRVIVCNSQSIYDNLALEDWIYENVNLTEDENVLLLWRNKPCVVMGKFQNPWQECNLSTMAKEGVQLGDYLMLITDYSLVD